MRFRPTIFLPFALLIGTINGSAQVTATDSVFAPGQVWQVAWSSGDVSTLTVPEISSDDFATFEYDDGNTKDHTKRLTVLHYLQSDTRIDHLTIMLQDNDTYDSQACVYTRPSGIEVEQSVKGFEVVGDIDQEVINQYYRTGDTAGNAGCTMKRVK